MDQPYMTPDEAAGYTGLSKSYLAKLRMGTSHVAGPKFLRIGLRAIRYRRCDLDAWLDQHIAGGA